MWGLVVIYMAAVTCVVGHSDDSTLLQKQSIMLDDTPDPQLAQTDREMFINERTCSGNTQGRLNLGTRDCPSCWMANRSDQRLFLTEPGDGLGSRTFAMIVGMAVAAKFNMNFGGVFRSYGICNISHKVDIFKSVTIFFGLENPQELYVDYLNFDRKYTVREFATTHPKEERILLSQFKKVAIRDSLAEVMKTMHETWNDYMTPKFLAALRRPDTPLMDRPLHFAPGRLAVALHIRRGDALKWRNVNRLTPDDYYFDVVERIRRRFPMADVHVFSEGEEKQPAWRGYLERNMTLHLTGNQNQEDSAMEAWAHFARADVLVMAKSSFSHVPAFLNPHCVIFTQYTFTPMEAFTPMEEWLTNVTNVTQLDACLSRARNATAL